VDVLLDNSPFDALVVDFVDLLLDLQGQLSGGTQH
jgi:hypothetical protein